MKNKIQKHNAQDEEPASAGFSPSPCYNEFSTLNTRVDALCNCLNNLSILWQEFRAVLIEREEFWLEDYISQPESERIPPNLSLIQRLSL
jgi:hypothetical protein